MNLPTNSLIAIDVETSGPDPFRHELTALALVPLDERKPALEVFVRHASVEWTKVAEEYFLGYRNDWETLAVGPKEAYERVRAYCDEHLVKDSLLVGHNIGFDHCFLKKLIAQADGEPFPNLSHRVVDTHSLLRLLAWHEQIPVEACTSSGAFQHFGIEVPGDARHTARGDAVATAELLRRIFAATNG